MLIRWFTINRKLRQNLLEHCQRPHSSLLEHSTEGTEISPGWPWQKLWQFGQSKVWPWNSPVGHHCISSRQLQHSNLQVNIKYTSTWQELADRCQKVCLTQFLVSPVCWHLTHCATSTCNCMPCQSKFQASLLLKYWNKLLIFQKKFKFSSGYNRRRNFP